MRARLTQLLPQLGFGALVAAVVAVPVVFSRQAAEAFMVPKVTLLWWALLAAAAGLAVTGLAERRWPVPAFAARWPLAALVAWTAVAAAASPARATSVLGRYGRYDGLLGVAAGAVVVACVVGYGWRRTDRLAALAVAVVASGAVGVAYVTIQQAGWDWVDWHTGSGQPIPQPYGLLGNSNFSGAHLAIAVPFTLALRHRTTSRGARAALLALAAWLAVGVWWTATRGGLLALVGGLAVAVVLVPALAPRVVRLAAVTAAAGAVALVLVASAADSVPGSDLVGNPAVLARTTLAERQEIWSAAGSMVADHPLVGVGPDGFALAYPAYGRDRATTVPLNADEAHDIFLDRAATAGLPALAAQLWLLATVAVLAWRGRRRVPEDRAWLLAAFGGGTAAYLLQGVVSIDVVPLALLGWLGIGGLTVLTDPALDGRRATEPGPVRGRPVPLAALAAIVAVAAAGAVVAARPLLADVRYRDGLEAAAAGRPGAEVAAAFEAATRWLPTEPLYHQRLADQLVVMATGETADPALRSQLLAEAVLGYQQALDRAPGDRQVRQLQARALVRWAGVAGTPDEVRIERLGRADALYTDLVALVPADLSLRVEHGLVLEGRAQLTGADDDARRARDEYRAALDLDGSSVDARRGLVRLDAGR